MKDIGLLFEYNRSDNSTNNKYKKHIKLITKGKYKYWQYINNYHNFSGDSIRTLIGCLNHIIACDKFHLPIEIKLNSITFNDKLVFIILECICYYMINYAHRLIHISFDYKKSIWTDGISFSSINFLNKDYRIFNNRFYRDNQAKHFREIIDYGSYKTYSLSTISNKIYKFLLGLELETDTIDNLCESIIEIAGNSIEHGHSDCLIDIDVTEGDYRKIDDTEDLFYYGINVVVLNFSNTPFYRKIKNKLSVAQEFNDRYIRVKEAKNNHSNYFSDEYTEEDFYTVASFQHKISGSIDKANSGGVGLTQLIKSLEEKSSGHLCYMLSQKRALYFQKEFLQYDSDQYIWFNKENDFYAHIPDKTTFADSNTFFPGTAYNLNFAIKKGDLYHGE
ncbi:MAG: hypothetical protein ACI4J7_05560 [Ruminiclostridium sp.]